MVLENGQTCEWEWSLASFTYSLNLTRAADGADSLSLNALNASSTLKTSAPVGLGLGSWVRLSYSRTADHANSTEGLLVRFYDIVDPFYVPPPPPEPEPELPEPEPVPEEGVSMMLILAIVVPVAFIIGAALLAIALIKRRRRLRLRKTVERSGSDTCLNGSSSNLRSFSPIKGIAADSELSPQRSSLDFQCEPIAEQPSIE